MLISLFAAGLKLGLPLSNKHWRMPVRLAFVSMTLTVAMIVPIAMFGLGMSLGEALLLGAILAPADPVPASDVQVEDAGDRDRLRFSLTAEGGLNDGAAFPFVMLGLGLLGLHDMGAAGWRWLAVDVLWAIAAGLGIGAALGTLIGKLVVYFRSRHQESVGLDEFLAVGLITLAYGIAVLAHAYGFLAVFAAGLALQRVKEPEVGKQRVATRPAARQDTKTLDQRATHPEYASAYMTQAVRGFNEQLGRIGEVAVVLVGGSHARLYHARHQLRLVRLARLCAGASAVGLAWAARRTHIERPAQLDFLVWHPRNRLDLLFDVYNQSRIASSAGGPDHRHYACHGHRLHRPARHFRDPADAFLREEKSRTLESLTSAVTSTAQANRCLPKP